MSTLDCAQSSLSTGKIRFNKYQTCVFVHFFIHNVFVSPFWNISPDVGKDYPLLETGVKSKYFKRLDN